MATEDHPPLNNGTSNIISIVAAIQAVQALPDIDEDLLFEAFDFLEKGKNAAVFIAMNTKLRSKWLRKKLHPQAMEIFVKRSGGKTLTLYVSMLTTIEELKAKLQAMEGYPSSKMIRLLYAGKLLEDGRSISDYLISDGSTIHMLLRLCGC